MRNHIKLYSAAVLTLMMIFVGMREVEAQGLSQGSDMPLMDRSVEDVQGKSVTLSDLSGSEGTVVVFWSNDCMWTSRLEDRLQKVVDEFQPQGIEFVLVNSNDAVAFPRESAEEGRKRNYSFPYIVDSGSQMAVAFGAERTPHVFVFDGNNKLIYKGAIDDSPGDPSNVKTTYLKNALSALLAGQEIEEFQSEAFGCNIKFQK